MKTDCVAVEEEDTVRRSIILANHIERVGPVEIHFALNN